MTEANSLLHPTQPHERIQTLDVLRGFALFGVLLINMQDMAGFGVPGSAYPRGIDPFVSGVFSFLVGGRFKGLFSILFGIGFAIQIQRARARGAPFLTRYIRRSLVLAAFGMLHFLLYPGDILSRYAVLGLFLLPLYRAPSWIIFAFIVLLGGWRSAGGPLIHAVPTIDSTVRAPNVYSTVEPCRELTTRYNGRRQVYAEGPVRDVIVVNACRFPGEAIGYWIRPGRIGEIFAYFLIGLLLGRSGIVRRFSTVLPSIRRVAILGAIIGFPLLAIRLLLPQSDGAWDVLSNSLVTFGRLATTLAYGGGVILLLQHPLGHKWLSPLGAMGRMALTVYLAQTVVYSTMFYGYGLDWGIQAGHLALLALAVSIYLAEVLLCNVWLRYFRYGPLEWLWRALTYLRIPPSEPSASPQAP